MSPLRLPFRLSPRLNRSRLTRTQLCRPFSTTSSLSSRLRQPGEPSGPNAPPRHTSTPPSKSPLKVWPILAIFFTGTFLFKKIVDERKEQGNPAKGAIAGHSPSRP
ncbi:hypothetical protein P154DRAFT_446079 [Amniculicola lignicola CBS 123094]|uniref:Uncharacterized protein n=1 Tax=Amniculicola lignicola CBS 123094 TaxID=1392246 RepID=A0A6A5W0B8_9PLEO|nr:hypothetical protein P154DRAFT_446079 [Amniculicola lignicola CBS 123094]